MEQYNDCATSLHHPEHNECATVQNKTNIGMKKHGICIPKEYGHDIKSFEDHLKNLRETTSNSNSKVASGKLKKNTKIITKKRKINKQKSKSWNIFNLF
jgi:hypothetical protein